MTTIGEQVTLQRGFDITKSQQRAGTVPVISSGGVASYHDESAAVGPGVVLGRKGVVGSVHYVGTEYWPHDTTLWVKDFHGNNPRFVYYFFRWMSSRLASMDVGSANPTLNRNHVHPIGVRWPTLPTQRRIAKVLGALDDKVALNRKLWATIETAVRTLFKRWFLEPSRSVDWREEALGDHVDVVRGLSYNGAGLVAEGVPLHNLDSVWEGGGYKYEGIKYYAGEFQERHVVRPGDLVVANTEQGFDYLLIGCPAIVPDKVGPEGLFSHHLFRVRPRAGSPLSPRFLYLLLCDQRFRRLVTGYANGTTVNMLAPDGLRRPRLAVPPAVLIAHFDELTEPLFARQAALHGESALLARLRDMLLPRLLSGELRVRHPEAMR